MQCVARSKKVGCTIDGIGRAYPPKQRWNLGINCVLSAENIPCVFVYFVW